jgi:hypothetical protein
MTNVPDAVPCEVCGQLVAADETDETGIVIEFWNFLPEYRERYGFCSEHVPEDLDQVKDQIRRGEYL